MKRIMVLFGHSGCRAAQAVVYAACAGAWCGETELLVVHPGETEALTQSILRYERCRSAMETLPGSRLGWNAALTVRTWPEQLPAATLADWAESEEDQLLLKALFSEKEARQSLRGELVGCNGAARAVMAHLTRCSFPLTMEEDTRVVLVGSLADGWSAAGLDAFARQLQPHAGQAASVLLMPYAGQDEHAQRRSEEALSGMTCTQTVYVLGTAESDCASADPSCANLVEWLAACCSDAFFREEAPSPGLKTYRAGAGRLGWESFPPAYRVCFGSLMKTAAAFRLTYEPVIRRGLISPKWLRDKMIGWYAGYFRHAADWDDQQRASSLALLEDVQELLTGYMGWVQDVLRNMPPLLRSSSAMEQARQEAADNYRQYIETAGQLMVMLREAQQSGLMTEKVVHRHDMADNEAERMQKIFQQMEAKKQALAARQEQLNQRIGGSAQLLMMKETLGALRARSEELHAQAAQAAQRIDEAAAIAAPEEMHRIATARTKLQRMERYVAQVDACMLTVRLERDQAKKDGVRRLPPEIGADKALPENNLFSPLALEKLLNLPDREEKGAKRAWAEAEAACAGLVLPESGSEAALSQMTGSLKTREGSLSPVAALLRDTMLAAAKEVR